MQGDRMRRVSEAVREVVSSALVSGDRDPRIGFVTITEVRTSPDLRHATVFVSMFGESDKRAESLEALDEARKDLQHEIALHLRMKNTPKLKFEYDDSVDRSMRVNELINQESQAFDTPAGDTEETPNGGSDE
ncbi:MAG: 30S ribosome-binding factor RbfA [Solirubrobacterales bacterium]